jgi:hypothetical protein
MAQRDRIEEDIERLRHQEDQLWRELGELLGHVHTVLSEVSSLARSVQPNTQTPVQQGGRRVTTRVIIGWIWIAYAIIVSLSLAVLLAVLFVQ